MPFSSEPAVITHTGNGSSDTQAISFVYYAKSDVVVKRRTAADTALTTLVLDTDYTLTAAADENGGTLTFTTAPASGLKTFIYLDVPNTQSTRYKQGGADSASTKNADLDKIIQRLAFLEERVKRAWCLPLADTTSDMEGVIEKATLLGKLAQFNASTGKLEGVNAADALNGTTVMTTRGDMIYRNASGAARLAVGAANTFLSSDGTDPVWAGATGTAWTPVLTFATPGDLAVTYAQQTGRYIRIGALVYVSFSIQTSAFTHTTASGNCRITGLPVTPASVTAHHFQGSMRWSGITKANYTQWGPINSSGNTYLEFGGSGSGVAADDLDTADMPSGGTVIFRGNIAYFAA